MKKIIFLILIFMSTAFFGTVGMHINLANSMVKQGKVEQATIYLDEPTAQKLLTEGISGQNLENTIYFLNVGPFTKSDNNYEAEAKVIFLKVPERKVLQYQSAQGEFSVTWSPVEVIPTEASQQLIFEQFSIPHSKNILLWITVLALTGILLVGLIKVRKGMKVKAALKQKRLELRDELLNGNNYSEVVDIWKKRELFLEEFPVIISHFKNFEQVLFKYQFKPTQTEAEKNEVMQAYRVFIENIKGGLNGI